MTTTKGNHTVRSASIWKFSNNDTIVKNPSSVSGGWLRHVWNAPVYHDLEASAHVPENGAELPAEVILVRNEALGWGF